MPGGGINALRGESNVQGSTDFALLSHLINGYLPVPNSTDNADRAAYLAANTPKVGIWSWTPRFFNSYLLGYYGPYAKKNGLDKAYDLHPKVKKGKNYTHIGLFEDMYAGVHKGCIAWGQNPVVGGPNTNLEAAAMDKLEWFVAADLWDTESMNFWQRPGIDPKDNQTEVWSLPAAGSTEKSGSVTNSSRLSQFRWKATEAPGDAESDLWMIHQLMKALKELYETEGGPAKEAITELFWDYEEEENGDPNIEQIWVEINGFTWPEGEFSWEAAFNKPVFGFSNLKDDGSTCCGIWIYCGSWASNADMERAARILELPDDKFVNDKGEKLPISTKDGKAETIKYGGKDVEVHVYPRAGEATEWNGIAYNKCKWHFQKTPVYYLGKDGTTIYTTNPPADAKLIDLGQTPNWAWCWPVNRRIIYNRASCDWSGKPYAPDKAIFTFKDDETLGMQNDIPDFYSQPSSDPAFPPELKGKATMRTRSGSSPFFLNREVGALVARLFSNSMIEGPFPEHYEPRESPVHNVLSKHAEQPGSGPGLAVGQGRPGEMGLRRHRGPQVSLRRDHLPGYRALAGGTDDPQPLLAGRGHARAVRGALGGARGRAGHQERGPGGTGEQARQDAGRCGGHGPPQAPGDRGQRQYQEDTHRRDDLALRLHRPLHRRSGARWHVQEELLGQPADRACWRRQYHHPGVESVPGQPEEGELKWQTQPIRRSFSTPANARDAAPARLPARTGTSVPSPGPTTTAPTRTRCS